jgi:putative nucleotidyltransferase with HDIG domain
MENLLFEKILLQYHHYVDRFSLTSEMELKYQHSKNVALIAKHIAGFVAPSEAQRQLVEIAALYHDIGRYEQFLKYKTFNDEDSEDHGTLGVDIIQNHQFFAELDPQERETLFQVIESHNKKTISSTISPEANFICKMVRDADKMDILQMLSSHFQTGKYDPILSLGLPDETTYNPLVVSDLLSAKSVDFKLMQSLNDFKLVNLGWVYDLNFAISYVMLYQQKYLEKIYQSLTVKAPEIDMAYQMVDGICEAYMH